MECLRKESLPPGRDGTADTLRRMAVFVRQSDAHRIVKATAAELVKDINPGDLTAQAERVFFWVRDSLRYVRDIKNVEELTAPWTILESVRNGGYSHSSDCDDHAVLLAALLRSIGFNTRFVAVASGRNALNLDHVRTEVLIRGYWFPMEATIKSAPFGRGVASVVQPVTLDLERGEVEGVTLSAATGDEPMTRYTSQLERARMIAELQAKQAADKIAAEKATAELRARHQAEYEAEEERKRKEAAAKVAAEQARVAAAVKAAVDNKHVTAWGAIFDISDNIGPYLESVASTRKRRNYYWRTSSRIADLMGHPYPNQWEAVDEPSYNPSKKPAFTEVRRIRFSKIGNDMTSLYRFIQNFESKVMDAVMSVGMTSEDVTRLNAGMSRMNNQDYTIKYFAALLDDTILADYREQTAVWKADFEARVTRLEGWINTVVSILAGVGITGSNPGAMQADILKSAAMSGLTKVSPMFAAVSMLAPIAFGTTGSEKAYAEKRKQELEAAIAGYSSAISSDIDGIQRKVAELEVSNKNLFEAYRSMMLSEPASLYGLDEKNVPPLLEWVGRNLDSIMSNFGAYLGDMEHRIRLALSRLPS